MTRLKRWCTGALQAGFFGVMGAGVWLMWAASAEYAELGEAHPFFLEKLPLARPGLWLAALYVHVPSALLALPLCLLLLSRRPRARFRALHRWLGRLTGALVLLAVVPSGLYLAFFAQGGLVTTLGFWLTGGIACWAMLESIASARAGELRAHRRYSLHVTAQLSVAVVSRLLLLGAEQAGLYAGWVYVAALWVPVVGCALVVERLAGPGRSGWVAKGARHEARLVVSGSGVDVVRESGARGAPRGAFEQAGASRQGPGAREAARAAREVGEEAQQVLAGGAGA